MKIKKRIDELDEQLVSLRATMVVRREKLAEHKDRTSFHEYEKARKAWFKAVEERERLKTKLRYSEFAQKYPDQCKKGPGKVFLCCSQIIRDDGIILECPNYSICRLYNRHLKLMESTPSGQRVKMPKNWDYIVPTKNCVHFEIDKKRNV